MGKTSANWKIWITLMTFGHFSKTALSVEALWGLVRNSQSIGLLLMYDSHCNPHMLPETESGVKSKRCNISLLHELTTLMVLLWFR